MSSGIVYIFVYKVVVTFVVILKKAYIAGSFHAEVPLLEKNKLYKLPLFIIYFEYIPFEVHKNGIVNRLHALIFFQRQFKVRRQNTQNF